MFTLEDFPLYLLSNGDGCLGGFIPKCLQKIHILKAYPFTFYRQKAGKSYTPLTTKPKNLGLWVPKCRKCQYPALPPYLTHFLGRFEPPPIIGTDRNRLSQTEKQNFQTLCEGTLIRGTAGSGTWPGSFPNVYKMFILSKGRNPIPPPRAWVEFDSCQVYVVSLWGCGVDRDAEAAYRAPVPPGRQEGTY